MHRTMTLALVMTWTLTACSLAHSAQAQDPEPGDGTLLETGFEDVAAGAITELEGAGGTWRAPTGHAAIHTDHQKSGRQSLRILGGAERGVEFAIGLEEVPGSVVSFWAERWTSRGPFEFRVHGRINGRWRELFNGDAEVAVGGFNTHVQFAVPAGTDRLRFIATTPDNSGVMIDDLRIGDLIPMRIKSVNTLQPVSPALVGNRTNPVALIAVETVGMLEPITLQQLRINTAGTTDLGDVEAVEIYYTGTHRTLSNDVPDANFPEEARFGRTQRPGAELTFRGEQVLQEGVNYFWVSYTLKDSADIDGRVDAGCAWVRLDNSREQVVPDTVNPDGAQRLGVVMRTAHDDGIRAYRIPGMATTNHGTLIAVYDNRNHGWGDLPGDIDVGMSRSTDGGRTWEPMKIIMDMGNEDGAGLRGNGIGDPAVLVDTATNTIWVGALWSHGNRGWNGSGPGMTPEETGQFILVKSEDDGLTWSDPINITEQIKDPSWRLLLQGPGKGITMSDGALVFPAQFRDAQGLPHSTLIYSRDGGEHWEIGTGTWDDTTEAQVVELEDGVLMLNCRYNRQNRRVVRTSTDMGATWEEHPTTRDALTEPGSCMASLINVDRELGREYTGVLLFSNPASTAARQEMTIKASVDGGMTWPEDMQVLLDHGRGAGYSCLTMIDEHYVGIVYEGNRAHMTFQRIPLAELIGEKTE
ncbi:exo-alpha-sialidase [Phycisphaeraceae bacterium D3-23]